MQGEQGRDQPGLETENLKDIEVRLRGITPCNVSSVLQRLFSTVGDSISTAEAVQYCGGCSVLREIASVLQGDSISTVVGDSISTVEG